MRVRQVTDENTFGVVALSELKGDAIEEGLVVFKMSLIKLREVFVLKSAQALLHLGDGIATNVSIIDEAGRC